MKHMIITICLALLMGCGSDFYRSISTKNPTIGKPTIMWYRIEDKIPPNTIVCQDAFGVEFRYAASRTEYFLVRKGMWFVVKINPK